MSKRKISIGFTLLFCFLFTSNAISQESESEDSLQIFNSSLLRVKPQLHHSIGSSFTYIPRFGSISGLTASSFLLYPVTPRLSIEGGLIAGRYYSALKNFSNETGISNSFNTLSVFGTATYQLSQRLSVYGTGIKQLAGPLPLINMPSSSFTIGSTLNFGNFSVGASIQMSDRNNYYQSSPFGGKQSYFPTYPW